MAAPPLMPADVAPAWAGPEMEWAEFEMKLKCPPHGQAHPPGPCPGQTPSLWVCNKISV